MNKRTFQSSGKLRASSSDTLEMRKSLKTNQGDVASGSSSSTGTNVWKASQETQKEEAQSAAKEYRGGIRGVRPKSSSHRCEDEQLDEN